MAGRKVRLLVKIERRIERARGEPRGSFEKKTGSGQRALVLPLGGRVLFLAHTPAGSVSCACLVVLLTQKFPYAE